jgi:hypothetical protein
MNARNFVVLTDTEAVINLRGMNPESINDIVILHSQTAELLAFHERLTDLLKAHDKMVKKFLTGGESEQDPFQKKVTVGSI